MNAFYYPIKFDMSKIIVDQNVRFLVELGLLPNGFYISKVSSDTNWLGPFDSQEEAQKVAFKYFKQFYFKQFEENKDFKYDLINKSIFHLKKKPQKRIKFYE